MDIQQMVRDVMANQVDNLGGEILSIKSQSITAIFGETTTERDIDGGSRLQRDLTAQFPTIQGFKIREGSTAEARGKEWKVDSIRTGKAMTTLVLIEPNRKEE
jgi:hypothetical protein